MTYGRHRSMLRARPAVLAATLVVLVGGLTVASGTATSTAAGAPYSTTAANGNDDRKSSWYPDQSGLTPALVTGGTFGPLWDAQLDQPNDGFSGPDQVYGQPLVYADPATGAATVVIATEANMLYGFDPVSGARRYKVALGQPFDPAVVTCGDLVPRVGITGTPAIDPSTGTAYVFSKQVVGGATQYVVYGYDAQTGAIAWSTVIAGNAQNLPDTAFDAAVELQRPGLILNQGVLYAAFAGHCDHGLYRGWVIGVDVASHQIVSMWAAQPNGTQGSGIWQSGAGIMSDGPGRLFVATGNASYGGIAAGAPPIGSSQPPAVLAQSVVRLDVQADRTLRPTSFFMPYDADQLDIADLDFASGGPVAIAPESLPPGLRGNNLLVAVGKQGYVYLLDRNDLGGFKQGAGGGDNVVSRVGPDGGVWSKPAVWPGEADDGGYVYIVTATAGTAGGPGGLNTYKVVTGPSGRPSLQKVATSPDAFAFSSGAPIVTSAGTTPGTGIVWTIWSPDPSSPNAELRAYRAVPDGGQLALLGRWPVGLSAKFASPVASGNRIFVATRDGHVKGFGSPVDQPLVVSTPAFATTIVGSSATAVVTVTANVAATITGVQSSSAAFTVGAASTPLPATLAAGDSLTVPVTFAPGAAGTASGQLVVSSDVGPVSAPLAGRALAVNGRLVANPAAVSMGGAAIGASISGSFSLSNVGGTALTISSVDALPAPFVVSAPALPYVLAPGASVQVGLTFSPTEGGSFVSSTTVTSDGGTLVIPVTASAAAPGHRTLAPASLDFPATLVGGHRTRGFTIGNDGPSPYSVSISKAPTSGQFVGAADALPEGTTIGAGGLRILPVQFTPTRPGPLADGWDLSTTEGSGRTSFPLTGTGLASLALPTPGPAWTTNGTAAVDAAGALVLTPFATGATGTAWYPAPVATDHVEAHYTAYLDGDGSPGADGMTLALVDATTAGNTAVGTGGSGLGFAGIGTGLAVVLSTFDAASGSTSLAGVAVTTPGGGRTWVASPVQIDPALHGASPGARPVAVDVWIDADAAGTRRATVLVDGTPVVTDLAVAVPASAYLGFTGAAGGIAGRHAVAAAPTILVSGLAPATCGPIGDGWKAEYFANPTLAGDPALCREDAAPVFDWADGSPGASVPVDGFSARWTKTIATGARTYTFLTGSDDGSRLYVDGRLVLNAWTDQTYTQRSKRVLLPAGSHTIVYEYYEGTGPARVSLAIR